MSPKSIALASLTKFFALAHSLLNTHTLRVPFSCGVGEALCGYPLCVFQILGVYFQFVTEKYKISAHTPVLLQKNAHIRIHLLNKRGYLATELGCI
ncbi:hypothetical protein V8E53_001398 [Lactarius tabidus]